MSIMYRGFGADVGDVAKDPDVLAQLKAISGGSTIWDNAKYCTQRPSNVTQTGVYQPLPANPGWSWSYFQEPKTQIVYIHFRSDTGGNAYWIYPAKEIPCGGSSAESNGVVKSAQPFYIKRLQQALNEFAQAGITVDGSMGPLTCAAAFNYQWEVLKVDSSELTDELMTALHLPNDAYLALRSACKSFYASRIDQPANPPDTEPDSIWKYMAAEKAGVPWWVGFLVAGGLIFGGVALLGDKKTRRKSIADRISSRKARKHYAKRRMKGRD